MESTKLHTNLEAVNIVAIQDGMEPHTQAPMPINGVNVPL